MGPAGYRIVEVPVSYHPRIGKSKISHTLQGMVGQFDGWTKSSRCSFAFLSRPFDLSLRVSLRYHASGLPQKKSFDPA